MGHTYIIISWPGAGFNFWENVPLLNDEAADIDDTNWVSLLTLDDKLSVAERNLLAVSSNGNAHQLRIDPLKNWAIDCNLLCSKLGKQIVIDNLLIHMGCVLIVLYCIVLYCIVLYCIVLYLFIYLFIYLFNTRFTFKTFRITK